MNQPKPSKITQALISVSDKEGLQELAGLLNANKVKMISTGGTYNSLVGWGLPVQKVSDFTGFPEIMDGRVKTLHPKIAGGIMARPGTDDLPGGPMECHGIEKIDLVVVNLYPFGQVTAKEGCALEDAIENIDIGGPTMLRAAAKNYRYTTVLVDPNDYFPLFWDMADNNGQVSRAFRYRMAQKVFAHTAAYDAMISAYLISNNPTMPPRRQPLPPMPKDFSR